MLFGTFVLLAASASFAVAAPGTARRGAAPSTPIKATVSPELCLSSPRTSSDDGLENGNLVTLDACDDSASVTGWALDEQIGAVGNFCVDIKDGVADNGVQLQVWICNGGPNQQFEYIDTTVIRATAFNKCLDIRDGIFVNGTAIQLWDCTFGQNQQWTFPQ